MIPLFNQTESEQDSVIGYANNVIKIIEMCHEKNRS